MRFWEASAVVPLLIDESTSADRRSQLEVDSEVVIWWGTYVECESALCRLEREGGEQSDRVWQARDRLNAFAGAWFEVAPADQVRRRAVSLLRVHPLRAADALQLAAGLYAAEKHPALAGFVCNDERLRTAARREGLVVH
jgi:hypothetical protein